jgi:hypothetical protein
MTTAHATARVQITREAKRRSRKLAAMLLALDLKLEAEYLAATGKLPTIIDLLRDKREWMRDGTEITRWREIAELAGVNEPSPASCALAETMIDAQIQVLFRLDVRRADEQAEQL